MDSKALLEGWTGRDEFSEYLPFEASPHLKNPPDGMIVTANNLCTVKPVGTPPMQMPTLQGYFKPGDRAGRIEELLATRNDWTLEDLRAVQMDNMAFAPRIMAPAMTRLARADESSLTAREREVLNQVDQWNFYNDVDNIGATVFNYWFDSLLPAIFGDELTEKQLFMYTSLDDSWIALQDLLRDTGAHWWDDITTPDRETAAQIMTRSLKDACEKITRDLGEDVTAWRWGKVHRLLFKHPFGYVPGIGHLLNIGPLASGGARETINSMPSKSPHKYDIIAGPSTRRLIDFARPDQSLTILPTGNSGHVRDPHYDDQAALFARGDYRTALYNRDEIEAAKEHEMHILPKH
ncbi:MAG: Penicillin acylase 2 precursor [Candidatus Hydrogenedentes bacterium ADurb.Bin179]|nr:MAG: Penicillin acylase 2 precursor [Candidatus Hydrogenedentes bacterium ADurb.Bin179]